MRNRTITTIGVLVTAAALTVTGCSSSKSKGGGLNNTGSNNTGSNGASKTYKIGFVGALSGDYAQLGINEKQGAQLAIEQANSSNKYPGLKFALSPQDSQGSATDAKPAAATLIADTSVVAVIGPAFSGESEAVNPDFDAAGLPTVTASASKGTLQTHGWKVWHRIIPNDNVEGAQGADWLARTGAKKVYVLDDASPYGQGVAQTMASELKAKSVAVVTGSVPATTTKNYNPVANTIKSSGADAIFYGGYDSNTALLAKALKGAGFAGREVTGNGSKDSTFTKNAAAAGDGWYFTCGCQDATIAPAAKQFATDYKARWGEDPSTYSPEAFDAANVIMEAISKANSSGGVTRANVLTAINATDYQGITTHIKFQPDGEVVAQNLIVNLFQQKNGAIVGLGDITQLK